MIDFENFGIGTCVIQYIDDGIAEGVVVEIKDKECIILWFDQHLNAMNSDHVAVFEKKYDITKNMSWQYAIIPHFCKIENLYSILRKYSYHNYFYLLGVGISSKDERNQYNKVDFVYLKTLNNTYLEIMICYRYLHMWTGEPIIWINEYKNLNQLNFYITTDYFHDKDIVKLKLMNVTDIFDDFEVLDMNGIKLIDEKERQKIVICRPTKEELLDSRVNGFKSVYNDKVFGEDKYSFIDFLQYKDKFIIKS